MWSFILLKNILLDNNRFAISTDSIIYILRQGRKFNIASRLGEILICQLISIGSLFAFLSIFSFRTLVLIFCNFFAFALTAWRIIASFTIRRPLLWPLVRLEVSSPCWDSSFRDYSNIFTRFIKAQLIYKLIVSILN